MKGLRVLIVEDEFLLAMSLEDDLVLAGCAPVGPFSSLASATEATRREEFDLAILDVNLNGEPIYPLADELLSRRKPFVLVTGYGAASLPERFRDLPRLPKPYDLASLVREISRAVPAAGRDT
jgi:DNA-binding NtrC family response regulator